MNKKYQVIYADPPWQYRHCASDNRKIENHYETMSEQSIKDLVIPADENCVLFMWVTAPKVAEAVDLIRAWGFDYRSCLVWDKEIMGLGYWSRVQHELIFVAVKGKISPPSPSLRISSMIRIKRASHSDKPDYFKSMIEKWYPKENKLEMFCREHTPLFKSNWDRWGNEVESDISLQVLPKAI